MATYEETRAAMAEGLTGFTHLFNAMRPLSAREPGPVAAALELPHAYYGLNPQSTASMSPPPCSDWRCAVSAARRP